MSTLDNAAVVQTIYDGFNSNDIERAVTVASDDFELCDMPSGQIYRGKEGFRQYLEIWKSAIPDSTAEVTNGVAVGPWVATEWTGRGTHTGLFVTPFGAVPPTGRKIELRFAELFQMKDGKIVTMRTYWDTGTLMRQIGVWSVLQKGGANAK